MSRALARIDARHGVARRGRLLPRLAPRQVRYSWRVSDARVDQVLERLLAATEEQTEGELRVVPADPQALYRDGVPGGVLARIDRETHGVSLGLRAHAEGRKVFPPTFELSLRQEGDEVVVEGTIKREYPDTVVMVLGLGMLSAGFGGVVGLVLASVGFFVPGLASALAGAGLFASSYAISQVALRAVNTRDAQDALVQRVQSALAPPKKSAGYR